MTERLKIFVSSVQKELEDERLIVQNLLNTDVFLSAHCAPLLYEFEPASPDKALQDCLHSLDGCQVCLIIIGIEYGTQEDGLSISHAEYRRSKEKALPILAFIKGDRRLKREAGIMKLLEELDKDGLKYKRFGNVVELQKEVRAALVKLLHEKFGIMPTSDEDLIAEQTIEATSPFESKPVERIPWKDLDLDTARRLIATAQGCDPGTLSDAGIIAEAMQRGLAWRDQAAGIHYATAAGIVLLAKDPSAVFPQCRILADAYRGNEPDGDPRDHEDIRAPMPLAIDRAMAFIDRNTRHPMRIVGLNRLRLDEYPESALREALVNAAAHRQYEDAGRKIILEVFADRVAVLSPGLPPAPITLAKLRSGRYRPCSRNPVLAQNLSYFHRIEERGSGFRRMRDQMLDHGLDQPLIGTDTGYFQVTFPGPSENIERIRVPEKQLLVTPAVEARLNDRQRQMARWLAEGRELTSRQCEAAFGITRPISARDFNKLIELGIAEKIGSGRSTRYRIKDQGQSSSNRKAARDNRKP